MNPRTVEVPGVPMTVKSRFDAASLGRSGHNVLTNALGVPADVTWERCNQTAWATAGGAAINLIESKALTQEPVSFDDLAKLISSWMGSDLVSQTIEERIAWGAVARLWSNAIVSRDLDLLDIERDAINWAKIKIQQSKPKPLPEVNGHAAGSFLENAIAEIEPQNSVPTATKQIVGKPSNFAKVIDMQVADYQQKIAALEALKKLPLPAQEGLWDLMRNAITQGE